MNAEAPQQPLLTVRKLCKHFPVYNKGVIRRQVDTVRAVHEVSFDLMAGETLGLVGESGSGKTTCARTILRALDPTSGEIRYRSPKLGEIDLAHLPESELKRVRREIQMVFQDPFSSLNPRFLVRDIVGEPLVVHGLAKGKDLESRVAEILEKVGLPASAMQRYPHAFSGGQRQRIGIARALILNPTLVVADEALSALDVSVQAQVINLLQDLQAEFDLTYIFVAHDLSVVRHLCDRVAVMYQGQIVELADTEQLFTDPQHAYTRYLLSAIPQPDPDHRLDFDQFLQRREAFTLEG